MTTKELTEWLDSKIHISFLPRTWNDIDKEMLEEIIKRLEEFDELRKTIELYRKYVRASRA